MGRERGKKEKTKNLCALPDPSWSKAILELGQASTGIKFTFPTRNQGRTALFFPHPNPYLEDPGGTEGNFSLHPVHLLRDSSNCPQQSHIVPSSQLL